MNKLTRFSLSLLIFSIPWEEAVKIYGIGTCARLLGYATLLFAFACIISEKELRELHTVHLLSVVFLAWSALTVFWSDSPIAALKRLLVLTRVAGLSWLIWQFAQTKKRQYSLIKAYIFGCCVSIASLFLNYACGVQRVGSAVERFRGAEMNENDLAVILAISIPFALHVANSEFISKKIFRWLYFLYCPIAGTATLMTGSRAGSIILILGIILATFSYYFEEGLKARVVVIIVIVAGLIGVFVSLPQKTKERLESTKMEMLEGSMGGRKIIYRIGFNLFLDNPVVGNGIGSFREITKSCLPTGQQASHSTYLGIAVETGAIGFILYFSIPLFLFIKTKKSPLYMRLFMTTILLMWFASGISLNWYYTKTTWYIFGLCAAIMGIQNEQIKKLKRTNSCHKVHLKII